MPTFDKHISELLYDHQCVIVPELGGFLTSYSHSHIHPTQHTLSPPSKKVGFNVFLKQNDGLLANHISQQDHITYPQAIREIEEYVELCHRDLNAGKKIIIEKVGTLKRDVERNLQFEPFKNINYLKDSFGLSQIQFMPVLHSDFEQEVEKQLRDFISLRPSQSQPRNAFARKKIRLNMVNTLLLTGSVLWFMLNIYIVAPAKINLASLNPFSFYTKQQPITPVAPAITKSEIYTQPATAKTETVFVKQTTPIAISIQSAASSMSKLDKAVSKKTSSQNFFIIAGAFKTAANAAKKETELKRQGFLNAHIIENSEGLKLVCYEGFASREEAFTELNRMKALNKEGWIFPR